MTTPQDTKQVEEKQLVKNSKVIWPRSVFIELHELCQCLGIGYDYGEVRNVFTAVILDDDDSIIQRFTDPSTLYTAVKKK